MLLQYIIKNNRDLALKAADQLPENRKRMFLLMMDGMKPFEIASTLKVTMDKVRVQLNIAQHAIVKTINNLN
jgi:hypothetical protein